MLYPVVTKVTMNELTERLTVEQPVVMGGADPTVEELRNRTGALPLRIRNYDS